MKSSMLVLAIGALFTSFGVSVSKGVSTPPNSIYLEQDS